MKKYFLSEYILYHHRLQRFTEQIAVPLRYPTETLFVIVILSLDLSSQFTRVYESHNVRRY